MTRRLTAPALKTFIQQKNIMERTPHGYSLQLAAIADLPALLQLAEKCFSKDLPDRRTLRYFINTAHAAFITLQRKQDGQLVGYSLTEANQRTSTLYINTICINPAAQQTGLGKFLCWLQAQLLKNFSYRQATAHIEIGNAVSLKLFQSQGFSVTAQLAHYYHDDGAGAYKLRLTSDAAADH